MILYPIFSRRIAYQLEKMGFKLIKIVPKKSDREMSKNLTAHSLKNLTSYVKKFGSWRQKI